MADGPAGESPAERRHRTLTELQRTVRRHPAVDVAVGREADGGRFRELRVEFDPLLLGVDAEAASLRVVWRPRRDPSDPAHFVFHYADSTGHDFGWHREPNPHIDRLEQFQERDAPDAEYEYEPVSFESRSPVDLCWDVLGRIEERV